MAPTLDGGGVAAEMEERIPGAWRELIAGECCVECDLSISCGGEGPMSLIG